MNGIFGQGMFTVDQNSTPEMLDRKRAALMALMPRYGRAATVGEGIGQLATGIASGVNRGKMDKFEGEKRAEASLQYNGLMAPKRQGPLSILGMRDQPSPEPQSPMDAKYPVGQSGPAPQGDIDEASGLPLGQSVSASIPTDIKNGIFAGESGGDYNALFGFQNRDGGRYSNVRLTDMTVDEALQFANPSGDYGQWVKGQVGRVATPMGAYQIVGTTLKAAKDGLGLSGDERMTPELQDALGHYIWQTQGTGAWEGYRGPQQSAPQQGRGQPAQFTQSGPDINELLMAAQNPWLSQEQRATINSQVQQAQRLQAQTQAQQMRQSDPLYQAQLAQAQFDLSQDRAGGGNTTEFGLTPQYITDADGNLSMVQLGKDGTVNQVQLPEGAAIQKGVEKLDLGTGYQWYNTITGQPIGGVIPKDNRGAARATAQGSAEGKATAEGIAAAPSEIAQAQEGIALIDSIINDPSLESITGMVQGRLPPMTQGGTDLNVKVEQLQGKAFLQAFESLKGGGAITESEGRAATRAMARLERAQSTEAYVEALDELKGIMQLGLDRARARTGSAPKQEIGQEFTSDTPIAGLSEDDADLWKYSTPEERQAIWGRP